MLIDKSTYNKKFDGMSIIKPKCNHFLLHTILAT